MPYRFEVDVVTDEFWSMMTRMNTTLEPQHFGLKFTALLRQRFREQVEESFANQAPASGGGAWPRLSDWRVGERGSSRPILVQTGSFFREVMRYKGEVRMINSGFSMWYPSHKEVSGRYWGLTAGQLVNPLGVTPLAAFPRRVLAGTERQYRDSATSMMTYFRSEGWLVDLG